MSEALAPDAGEVLRTWLGSVASITAYTGTRIGLSLTGPQVAIRYAQLGQGQYIGGGAFTVRFQVECWGAGDGAVDDGTSDALARTVLSRIDDMNGTIGSVRVAGAAAGYPYRQDDPTTGRPRNIVDVALVMGPT